MGFFQSSTDRPEISAPEVSVQQDAEPRSEKTGHAEKEMDEPIETHDGSDETQSPKKPLSFHLAFIGLATSLFVFQMDATCLGIALPVSYEDASFAPNITFPMMQRLTHMTDHSR